MAFVKRVGIPRETAPDVDVNVTNDENSSVPINFSEQAEDLLTSINESITRLIVEQKLTNELLKGILQ